MTIGVQITFDAADPHALARFWAEALGYQVEDHSEMVTELLGAGAIPPEATIEVEGKAAFAEVAAARDPDGKRPRLFLQKVPEAKAAKNRVHLDLHVGAERVEPEAKRLQELGATFLWTSDDRGAFTITLADPEGNELCVD
ncbi:MAG TPA: VOC family protein [Acidimicrobiales bacterium]|nr:VOC family protein [Acidimicrobiales bacterium]